MSNLDLEIVGFLTGLRLILISPELIERPSGDHGSLYSVFVCMNVSCFLRLSRALVASADAKSSLATVICDTATVILISHGFARGL